MRFGICNEVFEGWGLPDVFRKARAIGYDGVEIAPFTLGEHPADLTTAEREHIRQAAQDANVEVAGLHWLLARTEGFHLTSPDKTVRAKTTQYLRKLTHLCADLGGGVLVFGSPDQRSLAGGVARDEALQWATGSLRTVAETAQERGVVFCIEPLGANETNFINTADEALDLVRRVNSPNVGIILDVKAMAHEERPVAETVSRHIAHTAHIHANDPNQRGPGFGKEDFVPIMKEICRAGFTGYVSVEVLDFRPDPVTIATKSLHYLKECLERGADTI